MKRLNNFVVLAISIGLLGGTAVQASETGTTSAHVSVSYGDLDLTRQAGAEVLVSRLKTAAVAACGGRPDPRNLVAGTSFRACTREAMDSAMTRLDKPMVSALYDQSVPQVASAK